ncbi:MAG TPA: TIGR01777 family oxidoreductase [Bacillales bacterium]|nr:TIGR01777 family oxidoreductase [Bacillales bacterium]
MHIALTGGTGFIGSAITDRLIANGHKVSILTRAPYDQNSREGVKYVQWLTEDSCPEQVLADVDAIVNLAGESINRGRWTTSRKARILESRLKATDAVLHLIKHLHPQPRVLVNASAIGFYGTSEIQTFTEANESAADDFLASVVTQWETKAAQAEALGVRTVFARLGVVLGREGALPRIVLPYKLGIGGTIGTGRQWLSWVHVEDVARMLLFAIENGEIRGPLNVTAPEPVRMKPFGQAVGDVLHRPHWLPVPAFALRMGLGEMSDLILKGQRVLPEKALSHGFSFKFPDLHQALSSILSN